MSVFARWRGMKKRSTERVALTPAQRGQIVQRVIVDDWTSAEAAAAAGVPERLVDAWVADYRRDGMASLRHVPRKTVAAEIFRLWFGRPVRAVSRAVSTGLRRVFTREPPVSPSPLDRSNDDRRGGGS
jgi:leucine-zipper of insertion element IS481